METFYHTTADNRRIKLRDLEQPHLEHIIKLIECAADKGIMAQWGGGLNADEFWYEEELLSYEDGLKYRNYDKYVKELRRRKRELKTTI